MIVYRTGYHKPLIEEVEVERVSDKTIWFKNGIRAHKKSVLWNYFDTLQEAKEHLEAKYTSNILQLEDQIQSIKNKLKELEKY